jgi:hypothetical protein
MAHEVLLLALLLVPPAQVTEATGDIKDALLNQQRNASPEVTHHETQSEIIILCLRYQIM